MTVLSALIDKLRAEGLQVITGPPGKAIEPPAVILGPGTPDWLVAENWEQLREAVRVTAVVKQGDDTWAAIRELRAINAQVWKAAASVGALWVRALPPALADIQGVSLLASTNQLTVPLEEESEL